MKGYHWLMILAWAGPLVGRRSSLSSPTEPAVPAQTIVNIGSDTLVNPALAWAEAYM